jgi:hypothetical protein
VVRHNHLISHIIFEASINAGFGLDMAGTGFGCAGFCAEGFGSMADEPATVRGAGGSTRLATINRPPYV